MAMIGNAYGTAHSCYRHKCGFDLVCRQCSEEIQEFARQQSVLDAELQNALAAELTERAAMWEMPA